jgi:hypothetical protein
MSSFECPICCEFYDDKDFVPATLPCGHSTCRSHLVELPKKECPICRDVFSAELVIKPNIALRDGAVAYSELLKANREKEIKQLKDTNGKDSVLAVTEENFMNGSRFLELQRNSNKDSSTWLESLIALFGMKNTHEFELNLQATTIFSLQESLSREKQSLLLLNQEIQEKEDKFDHEKSSLAEELRLLKKSSEELRLRLFNKENELTATEKSRRESHDSLSGIVQEHIANNNNLTLLNVQYKNNLQKLNQDISLERKVYEERLSSNLDLQHNLEMKLKEMEHSFATNLSEMNITLQNLSTSKREVEMALRQKNQNILLLTSEKEHLTNKLSEIARKFDVTDSIPLKGGSPAGSSLASSSFQYEHQLPTVSGYSAPSLTMPLSPQFSLTSGNASAPSSPSLLFASSLLPSTTDEPEPKDPEPSALVVAKSSTKSKPAETTPSSGYQSLVVGEPEAPRSNDQWTTSSDSIYFGPKFARSHPLLPVHATVPSVSKTLNESTKTSDFRTGIQTLGCSEEIHDRYLKTFDRPNTMFTGYEERGLDFDPNSISSVMNQVNCTRDQTVKALRNNDSDLFWTIMELTTPTTAEEKEEVTDLPQSSANRQFWENYYNTVYKRDSIKAWERTGPLKGKHRYGETATGITGKDLLNANPASFAKEEKKNRKISGDSDLFNWFETLPPPRLHPTIRSPPHENCKTEFTSANTLTTGNNNLVRNYVNDKEDNNDKEAEMKINTIGVSFETPGKAFISGKYAIKGAAEENSANPKNTPQTDRSSIGRDETNTQSFFLPQPRSVAGYKNVQTGVSSEGADYRGRGHHFHENHYPSGNLKWSAPIEKELDIGNQFTGEKNTQQSPSSYIPSHYTPMNRSSLENYNVEFIPRKSPGNNQTTRTTTSVTADTLDNLIERRAEEVKRKLMWQQQPEPTLLVGNKVDEKKKGIERNFKTTPKFSIQDAVGSENPLTPASKSISEDDSFYMKYEGNVTETIRILDEMCNDHKQRPATLPFCTLPTNSTTVLACPIEKKKKNNKNNNNNEAIPRNFSAPLSQENNIPSDKRSGENPKRSPVDTMISF